MSKLISNLPTDWSAAEVLATQGQAPLPVDAERRDAPGLLIKLGDTGVLADASARVRLVASGVPDVMAEFRAVRALDKEVDSGPVPARLGMEANNRVVAAVIEGHDDALGIEYLVFVPGALALEDWKSTKAAVLKQLGEGERARPYLQFRPMWHAWPTKDRYLALATVASIVWY